LAASVPLTDWGTMQFYLRDRDGHLDGQLYTGEVLGEIVKLKRGLILPLWCDRLDMTRCGCTFASKKDTKRVWLTKPRHFYEGDLLLDMVGRFELAVVCNRVAGGQLRVQNLYQKVTSLEQEHRFALVEGGEARYSKATEYFYAQLGATCKAMYNRVKTFDHALHGGTKFHFTIMGLPDVMRPGRWEKVFIHWHSVDPRGGLGRIEELAFDRLSMGTVASFKKYLFGFNAHHWIAEINGNIACDDWLPHAAVMHPLKMLRPFEEDGEDYDFYQVKLRGAIRKDLRLMDFDDVDWIREVHLKDHPNIQRMDFYLEGELVGVRQRLGEWVQHLSDKYAQRPSIIWLDVVDTLQQI